jgi:glycosyltransferase involved in cell wall biosynthesis
MITQPVVRVVPFQPHCFAFGGFEVQMLSATQAAREVGANVQPLDPWSRDSEFDILHLWGCDIVHFETAKWAHLNGKKLVMSALFPYPSTKALLRYWASLLVGTARFRRPMLSWLSSLTVVNQQQARYAIEILGIPEEITYVVPNIVEDNFFERRETNIVSEVTIKNYVICTGNICRRKNQLSLVRACQRIGLPLLLIGDTLIGEEAYGNEVAAAIKGINGMQWIRGLPPNSPELVSAYHNSMIFALPSYNEQQPISALEAAAAGKPLLLSNRTFAKQELFTNAALAEPNSVLSIENTLREVLRNTKSYIVPSNLLNSCRRQTVGNLYLEVYRN